MVVRNNKVKQFMPFTLASNSKLGVSGNESQFNELVGEKSHIIANCSRQCSGMSVYHIKCTGLVAGIIFRS